MSITPLPPPIRAHPSEGCNSGHMGHNLRRDRCITVATKGGADVGVGKVGRAAEVAGIND